MPPSDFLPDLPDYNPEPADGFSVGDSPVPGLTLRRILRGHTGYLNRIAWSPDGQLLASSSIDETIRIWDVAHGKCLVILQGHTDRVWSVDWSPDGSKFASGSSDYTIRIWNTKTWECLAVLEGHRDDINRVAWSPDGYKLASASDDATIHIWNTETWDTLTLLEGHKHTIWSLAWSPNGFKLASGSRDGVIRIWTTKTWKCLKVLNQVHRDLIRSLAWSPDGSKLASASDDKTIRIWDTKTWSNLTVLEDHTDEVKDVAFSADGIFLVSTSWDSSTHIRLFKNWQLVCTLQQKSNSAARSIAIHPNSRRLVTMGEEDTILFIWDLDVETLLSQTSNNSIRYTTAKLVLVGDSGVGKTGLGYRLAHNQFKEHASTHGQQFWVIDQLGKTRDDGTECEAVLWDLAGQHVYRSVHSIFLDNVDAAMVLFDPSNRQDPLKGVEFWLEQLKGKAKLPPSVLVGARVDRGAPTLSQQEMDQFCQRYGISGGYISTSAMTGEGLQELLALLKVQIPWDEMTTTVTTVTFKRIKDYVLALKEKPDRENVLVSPKELRQQLQTTDPDWQFTDAEMMTAVGHLENHGYVCILRGSAGDKYILLTPDLLVSLAASIVLQADKHPRELGAVNETELLQGNYAFDELKGLEQSEQQILLDAAVLRFLDHSICFRETLDNDTLLIFPGLIKQKRPLQDDIPFTDDISYIVRGQVENIYATLVVLLGYTPSFIRINHWQNQAQYEIATGQVCGFRMIEEREGEIELVLYYGDKMPSSGRKIFQELFEQFLYQREVEVTRFPPVICPNSHRLERATVTKRSREGKTFAFCDECGSKVDLPAVQQPSIGTSASPWLQREEAIAHLRKTYETYLSKIKSYRRSWAAPRCYLSHVPEQKSWVKQLIHDLQNAQVYLVSYADQVKPDDYVVVIDTPAYQQAWKQSADVLKDDVKIIQERLVTKRRFISICLESQTTSINPHDLKGCNPGDFSNPTHYPVNLFNLVLNLYAIPFDHPGFAPLRETLHEQWEATLSKFPANIKAPMQPLKVFISYAHKDEAFKDELVTMLASMQRRGIIDAWQDRRIEPGDEWYQAIQTAMNECDLAVLLVSKNFLASRFINDKEVPQLLKRRKAEGMRVIPIIIRPCMWSSEPVLRDLQALPQDGKAVISFSEENGDRDQVWTDIAKVIEKQAKEMQSEA
ncbi:MAG TPA: TIR domain-containing protein [Trichormus sp. M33_DOE_039]|nr:TIR domain-containing protein [Trichormus sp. M33_DOE_039]